MRYYIPDSVAIDTAKTDTLHTLYASYKSADSILWQGWASDTSCSSPTYFYSPNFNKAQIELYVTNVESAVAAIKTKLGY